MMELDLKRKWGVVIKEATIIGGWPGELESLKERVFNFTDGVNILFGPNGCGKTTLLQILGAYAGCPEFGGWSKFIEPKNFKFPYPKRFELIAPGRGRQDHESTELAHTTWDGSPVFLHMAHRSDQDMNYFGSKHDLMTDMQSLSSKLKRRSTGQERLARIAALCEALQSPPDLSVADNFVKNANEDWVKAEKEFREYVAKCADEHGDGPITCLLDEPTRSMDIVTTVAFWKNVIPKLAENCQLIIATHCPLLLLDDFYSKAYYNFIDMRVGYEALASEYLSAMLNDDKLPIADGSWWA